MLDKKEYYKKYRQKNREKIKLYRKEWWKKNRKRIKLLRQQDEKLKIYQKEYWEKNKEKLRAQRKKWAQDNPEKVKIQRDRVNELCRKNPHTKYIRHKNGAKHRNIEWNLTYNEFLTFWQKPCYYCGEKTNNIGIDRIDSSKGYIKNNCVSCCKICNYMKRNYTQKFFINHCKKITKHLVYKNGNSKHNTNSKRII